MDKMLRRNLVLAILSMGCILTGEVQAATLEVAPSGYPYTSIQAAINAVVDGDTVLVHDGTYVENINFLGKAITVKSVNGAASTINGNGSSSVVTFNHGEGSGSVLDGFTITNGYAAMGGGIYCDSSSPTISNCTISENTSTNAGGGISCWNSSSPIITNCTVSENRARFNGGGISCYGTCSPIITNCTIIGNTSGWGGGISCGYSSSPSITNCTVSANAGSLGGGISCDTSCSPTMTNCIVTGNTASTGGGIYCYSASSPTIINSTISGNTANTGGGIYCDSTSSSSVKNTILWGDVPNEIYLAGNSITMIYSDVDQDGYAGSSGNIRQDPLFFDSANGDFSLQSASPCIDAGTSDGSPATDMKDSPRSDTPQIPNTGGGTYAYYDMGALEYVPLPDLTGQWASLAQTCKNTRSGLKCKVSGRLNIQNVGTLNAPSCFVRFYRSTDEVYNEGIDALKQVATGTIKVGKSKTKTFSYSFPLGETASGEYIIAVIDADKTVAEGNEGNNHVVFGPIP